MSTSSLRSNLKKNCDNDVDFYQFSYNFTNYVKVLKCWLRPTTATVRNVAYEKPFEIVDFPFHVMRFIAQRKSENVEIKVFDEHYSFNNCISLSDNCQSSLFVFLLYPCLHTGSLFKTVENWPVNVHTLRAQTHETLKTSSDQNFFVPRCLTKQRAFLSKDFFNVSCVTSLTNNYCTHSGAQADEILKNMFRYKKLLDA